MIGALGAVNGKILMNARQKDRIRRSAAGLPRCPFGGVYQGVSLPVVTVIGGTNVDIQGFPAAELRRFDSNPGRVRISSGGVARNIAENLAKLGETVRFMTSFGSDAFARQIRDELDSAGVDCSSSRSAEGENSSVYLCVLDNAGRLDVAVADMQAIEAIDPAWIDERSEVITGADLCVVDTNLRAETIEHLVHTYPGIPMLLDTVSHAKASRAARCVGGFAAIKPNLAEAEVLSGISIGSDVALDQAAGILHQRGAGLLFISLGSRGVYFSQIGNAAVKGIALTRGIPPVNVSGAGDALTAAVAYGMVRGDRIEQIARFAVAAADITAQSPETVNRAISAEAISELSGRIRIELR